jgi:sugar-specific transcriptional regulator TrmB
MKDLVKQLEAIGFTNYESKVFMVLMQGHNMTAAEIAKEAKIPRTSVYEILKSFAQKGICNEIETPSKLRYEMIDPDVVEDKLHREIKNSYDKRASELDSSFKSLKSLYKAKAQKEAGEKIELLRGFNRHRHLKFYDLLKKSSREILITNKLPNRISDETDEEVDSFIERGGKMRAIYQVSEKVRILFDEGWKELSGKELVDLTKTFETDGVEVRLTFQIPQNFTVFDEKYVFLNIIDDSLEKENKSDLIIDNEQYATAMKDLFDYYWNNSMTISEFEKSEK